LRFSTNLLRRLTGEADRPDERLPEDGRPAQVENPSATETLEHLAPVGGDPIGRKFSSPYSHILRHPAIEFWVSFGWMIWRITSSGDLISM